MDTIYFFASSKDLCNIFQKIEQEFDIKYCIETMYTEIDGNNPNMEFHTIHEIADSDEERYLIASKTENIQVFRRKLDNDNKIQCTIYYHENTECVQFITGKKYPDMIGDCQVHIAKEFESEFAEKLFKRIVREVRKNCVKVNDLSPFYVGNDIYENKENYVFYGMRFAFPRIIIEENKTKRWWKNRNVREFMEKPFEEQLPFLRDVFSNKKLKNIEDEYEHLTEDYEIYQGIMYKMAINKELSLLRDIAALFDDHVKVRSPLYVTKTAMEELRDIAIDLAFSQKTDGIKRLLENLKYVPVSGYNCGNKEVITMLLKKKYFETLKASMPGVTDETKKLVQTVLKDISDKRVLQQKNEILDLCQ